MNDPSLPTRVSTEACDPVRSRAIPPLIAFAVIYVASMLLLRFVPMSRGASIAVALLPLPVFAFYLVRWIRAIRSLDELQQRIQLEALAIAFPMSLLLILGMGLLQMADALPLGSRDYLRLWPAVFWLYFVGLFVARKRYR
jgi:hypothetical protein